MKVVELLAKLQKYPPQTVVFFGRGLYKEIKNLVYEETNSEVICSHCGEQIKDRRLFLE